MINLVKIKDKYPEQRQKCLDILKEIMGEQQRVIKEQLSTALNEKTESKNISIDNLVTDFQQFNGMIDAISMDQLLSHEQVVQWCRYIMDTT